MHFPDRRMLTGLLVAAGVVALFVIGALIGEAHRDAERSVAARSGDPTVGARATGPAGASTRADDDDPWLEPIHDDAEGDPLVRPVGADDDGSRGIDPSMRAVEALTGERPGSGPSAPLGAPVALAEDGVATPLDSVDRNRPYGRFIDPCVESAGASSAGDEDRDPPCPPGVGATALFPIDGGRSSVEPLVIHAAAHSALPADVARCRQGIDREGTIYGQITTNHPAHLTIVGRAHDGTEVTVEAQTGDGERSRWAARRAEGVATTADPGSGIATCFRIRGLTGQPVYDLWVRGIDDRGSSAERGVVFADPRSEPWLAPADAEGGRPPILVDPHDGHVRAIIPVGSPSESVYATLLQRRGAATESADCTAVEGEVIGGQRSVSLGLLDRGDVPWPIDSDIYGPGFERARVIDVHGLDGTAADLCLWVVDGDGGGTVVSTRQFRLTAPDRMRYQVHLLGNRSDEALEADGLELRALDGVRPSATFPPVDLPGGEQLDEPHRILGSDGFAHHDVTRFELVGRDGETSAFAAPTPNRCADDPGCAPTWTAVRVPIPGSDSGEVSLAVEMLPSGDAGTRPAEMVDDWSVEGGTRYGADRRPDPGPIPVLDRVRSSAVVMPSEPGTRADVVVTVVFDRPVAAAVSMPVVGDAGPCHREPRTVTEEPSTTFVVTFPSVCFGTYFEFDVLALTPEGVVADHRSVIGGQHTGRRPVLRVPRTPAAPIRHIDHTVTWTPPRRVALSSARLVVGGVDVPLISGATPCPGSTDPLRRSGRVATSQLRTVPIGEPVAASLRLRARDCETGEELVLEHHEVITLERARAEVVRLEISGPGGRAEVTFDLATD